MHITQYYAQFAWYKHYESYAYLLCMYVQQAYLLDQDLTAPEEEEWSDEGEWSEPSIAPSDDTPTRFTRERSLLQ